MIFAEMGFVSLYSIIQKLIISDEKSQEDGEHFSKIE
jgi:hypothetical protein